MPALPLFRSPNSLFHGSPKMRFEQHSIELSTQEPIEIINITDPVKAFVAECGISNGMLNIGSAHTTVGLAINEECAHLRKDILAFLERLVPPQADYEHNKVAVDGRPNAHSHLLSLMLPPSQSLVVKGGELQLGTWQSIFAIELDGPRSQRRINLTLMGS